MPRNLLPRVEARKGGNLTSLKKPFAVSIKDEGFACRICVDSIEFAREILLSLSDAFVFQTSEPMKSSWNPPQCIFWVAYGSQLSHRKLASLLSAIPGLELR